MKKTHEDTIAKRRSVCILNFQPQKTGIEKKYLKFTHPNIPKIYGAKQSTHKPWPFSNKNQQPTAQTAECLKSLNKLHNARMVTLRIDLKFIAFFGARNCQVIGIQNWSHGVGINYR